MISELNFQKVESAVENPVLHQEAILAILIAENPMIEETALDVPKETETTIKTQVHV